MAATPESFEVYSGDDINTLPLLAVGAVGVISVAGHWVAPDLVEFFDAWERGDTRAARAVNDRLLESYALRDGRRGSEPAPVESDAPPSRPAGGPLPAAARA